jgi:8-oxo-dGTP diphosphatase
MEKVIKIGCEAYIRRNNKILLGKRGNVYGSGTWALPGGHLEYLERADQCLARELDEEMGIEVDTSEFKLLAICDDLQPENNIHYIHITYTVDIGDLEPQLLEPDACEEWRWFDVNDFPANIFPPHKKIFETIHHGEPYKTIAR